MEKCKKCSVVYKWLKKKNDKLCGMCNQKDNQKAYYQRRKHNQNGKENKKI